MKWIIVNGFLLDYPTIIHFIYQCTVFLAIFQVTLDGAVCVQEFSKSRALGRAYLRSSGRTIAVGVVNQIIVQDQN